MTIEYKNQGWALSTTNLTTVLTIDTSSRALVKSMPATNEHTANILLETFVHDASTSTNFEFFHSSIAKDVTVQCVEHTLVLEEGDSILCKADVSGQTQGVISYALINRSQENG